jgi:hypothetical protein
MYKIVCDYHEMCGFDTYHDLGLINPLRVFDAIGENSYEINDEKGYINYVDRACMTAEDYEHLIKNGYRKFFFEEFLPRKFNFKDKNEAYRKIYGAAKELCDFRGFSARMADRFINHYGVPLAMYSRYELPPEIIYWGMRGMKGLAMDMRKHPEELFDGLQELQVYARDSLAETVKNHKPSDNYIFDYRLGMLCHNILNDKQFEKYYLPYFKEYVRMIVENDMIGLIFIQGTADRIMEHLRDLPRGYFAVLLEESDIFEAKKQIGDRVALAGGLPVQLLRYGSRQECVDYTKRLIDEVGYDGSLILSPGKMLSYKNDADIENLLAINEFVKSYTG